jgi:hypothetical protein
MDLLSLYFKIRCTLTSESILIKPKPTMTSYRIVVSLFALISLALAFDLAAIKPRFPQQFMATITHDNQDYNGQYYGGQPYPCLFDFINKREKCGHRIRNFLNNTFTETNFTTTFPPKCNISSININNAKLLDPNWFDKLNLSLTSASTYPYTWMFTLKKPTLLEELPFAPTYIIQRRQSFHDGQQPLPKIPFNKIRNIVGEIHTSDPDFTWPRSMSLSFDTPGYECPPEYGGRDQSCRQNYSWTFTKRPSYAMIESGTVSVGDMFDILFSLPSFLPPCQNVNVQSAEQEEEEDD